MTKKKTALTVIPVMLALLSIAAGITGAVHIERKRAYTAYDLSDIPPEYDNLIIVAHPDDETLFGGAHLLEDDYLVVVVTAGVDFARAEELKEAVSRTGDRCIMLGYPDKVLGKRSEWKSCRADIEAQLTEIIESRDWKTIVTHNKDGEYGHIHHKMTHESVTDICEKLNLTDNLYFFGTYYKAVNIGKETDPRLDDDIVEKKLTLLHEVYKSQRHTIDGLSHMVPYESWIKYD